MASQTIQWETPGKVLQVDSSGKVSPGVNPIKDELVKITEVGNSFALPDFENAPTAGIPVDANLGIYLIKRLFDKLLAAPSGIQTEKWLVGLLHNSRALTIDKNALLKTLSQPGCEGLRFYLCLKYNEVIEANDPEDILSLVTVGIDKDGKDLGYEFDEDIAAAIVDNIFEVANKSLVLEYSFPPPPRTIDPPAAKQTYILGGYSWGNNF